MKRDFESLPAAAGDAISISIVRGSAALEALVPAWEELASNAIEPNPFYERAFLLPALREFDTDNNVEVLCVWHKGALGALLPCQWLRRYKRIPARTLVAWRHRHCPVTTPLLRKERAAEYLSALFRWLRSERRVSLVDLHYLAAGEPFHQTLVDVQNEGGYRALLRDSYSRALLCRAADAETYIRSAMSSDSRKRLRRAERRLRELGHVSEPMLRTGDDIGRWIGDFMRLEDSGWKGRQGSALGSNEPNRRFAEAALSAAFTAGRLLMVGIDLDGKPIARYSALLAGDGAFAFKTAYDERFADYSPGILARLAMIRAFHEAYNAKWMDSSTAPNNETANRLWKDRRVMQHPVIALSACGDVVLSLLHAAQSGKRVLRAARAATR